MVKSAFSRVAASVVAHANLVFPGAPTVEVIERTYFDHLLTKYKGNRRRVADALGVSERTAYRMLERHALRSLAETSPISD